MKISIIYLIKFMVMFLLFFASHNVCFAQKSERATFTKPRNGDVIINRREFSASMQINKFNISANYWVAIASVTGHNNTWERVLSLYKQLNIAHDDSVRSEMLKIISKWEIDLFWPKFYVPESPYESKIFDGGINLLHGIEPQPMILLVLKVDDTLQKYIISWLRNGSAGKGYPGIPASRLGNEMILGRCEIFFP